MTGVADESLPGGVSTPALDNVEHAILSDLALRDNLLGMSVGVVPEPRRAVFDRLLAALRCLYDECEAMQAFAPWPGDLEWVEREPANLPVASHVGDWPETGSDTAATVHRAMSEAAANAEWRLTYTEEEVGAHFLENYGYFELFGPDGHYRTRESRAFVAYWGPGLFYDWHHHEAEELYVIVSGSGHFHLDGATDAVLKRGDTRLHGSWQKHAMTTGEEPILTFVLWRGAGLEGLPKMGKG